MSFERFDEHRHETLRRLEGVKIEDMPGEDAHTTFQSALDVYDKLTRQIQVEHPTRKSGSPISMRELLINMHKEREPLDQCDVIVHEEWAFRRNINSMLEKTRKMYSSLPGPPSIHIMLLAEEYYRRLNEVRSGSNAVTIYYPDPESQDSFEAHFAAIADSFGIPNEDMPMRGDGDIVSIQHTDGVSGFLEPQMLAGLFIKMGGIHPHDRLVFHGSNLDECPRNLAQQILPAYTWGILVPPDTRYVPHNLPGAQADTVSQTDTLASFVDAVIMYVELARYSTRFTLGIQADPIDIVNKQYKEHLAIKDRDPDDLTLQMVRGHEDIY